MGCSYCRIESKSEIGLRHPPSRQQRGGSWRQVTCYYLRVEKERPRRTVGLLEAECLVDSFLLCSTSHSLLEHTQISFVFVNHKRKFCDL